MNTGGYGSMLTTKWNICKAKLYALAREGLCLERKAREKVLRDFEALNMPIIEKPSGIDRMQNQRHSEWTLQGENIDNGFVDMGGKYVQRTQFSWTGLYGKAPWPRERKLWEKG